MIIDYIIVNIQSHSRRFLVGKRLNIFLIVMVLICIVFFHPIVAFSEESTVIKRSQVETDEIIMSLDDCIDYALKHDPNLKIYEQTQVAQKSLVGQAKSTYFPTLLGGSSYNYQHNKTSKNIGMNNLSNNYYQLNIGINQLIWDFGRTNAKINMQKYNYEAAGYDLDYAILQTIYAVKTAYAALLAAKANEDIYGRSVKINMLNYDRTKSLYEEGLKSKIDVVNAQVYLTDAKINFLNAQNQYQTAFISLNNAMYNTDAVGYSVKNLENFHFDKNYKIKNEIDISNKSTSIRSKNKNLSKVDKDIDEGTLLTSGIEKMDVIKNYEFRPYEKTLQESIEEAYKERPDLKSLNLVKQASEESLKSVKRTYYPSIGANSGFSFQKSSDLSNSAITISAGMDLPTINAMDIKYKVEQSKAYLEIALQNIDLNKKNIYFEVQNNFVDLKQLEKRIPLLSQKVDQTLENFKLADGRYTVGLGNFIELQQAQTNYNNAQLTFVQSVYEYNLARFNLEKSMGVK